jgi:hypothetical protein
MRRLVAGLDMSAPAPAPATASRRTVTFAV